MCDGGERRKLISEKAKYYADWNYVLYRVFSEFSGVAAVSRTGNQAFPLVMGVEARENESFQLYLAYPDLLNEKASEHALASDAYWEGTVTDLFEGMRQMSENSSKNPDLNHLKVLLLNPQVFASDAAMEALLSFFEKKTDAAWNTYVLLTEEPMQEIFTEKLQLPECMGVYLEDLLEEWEHVKHNSFVTVGTLMQQFYEREGNRVYSKGCPSGRKAGDRRICDTGTAASCRKSVTGRGI